MKNFNQQEALEVSLDNQIKSFLALQSKANNNQDDFIDNAHLRMYLVYQVHKMTGANLDFVRTQLDRIAFRISEGKLSLSQGFEEAKKLNLKLA